MRRKLVVGNWKMHGSRVQVKALLDVLKKGLHSGLSNVDVGVCPTFLHIPMAESLLQGSNIQLGAQNANAQDSGALTGEVAAAMLSEFGVSLCLVGHSERRGIFSETDQIVAEKFKALQVAGLTPVLCLGESLVEREQNLTEKVILAQLDAVLEQVGAAALANGVVAYEPIWAIGTGKTATPEQAQSVHGAIREHIAVKDAAIAESVRILYGGSVKSSNAAELFNQADIDGGLVGGASLSADEFIAICKSADSK